MPVVLLYVARDPHMNGGDVMLRLTLLRCVLSQGLKSEELTYRVSLAAFCTPNYGSWIRNTCM